jgi:transcriptional regulator with XRE-family HTH domain
LIRTPTDLGEVLRFARAKASMSQSDLADWLGVSRFYVSSLESGEATERLGRIFSALTLLGYELHAAPRGELHSRALGQSAVPTAAEAEEED